MPKKLAISQSNYIPWKGYFDLINMADEFVLYDDVQYTKRDWRNRNTIQTAKGLKWLSIPVKTKGKYLQKINQTRISDKNWGIRHWTAIEQSYSNASHFEEYRDVFKRLYLESEDKYLSQINYKFIASICEILGVSTKIRWSSDFELIGGKTEKILNICEECNADIYLSGPSAQSYFDERLAKKKEIKIEWMDYSGYPEYEQKFSKFEHHVTVLDLIFNQGKDSYKFMNSLS